MTKIRSHRHDLIALSVLLLLPLLWFLPVLFPSISGLTLLPYDNLYSFEPWHSLRPDLVPHNNLLSDLVLQNAVWKAHVRQTFADGTLGLSGRFPLWNPQILTGLPFFAAGQSSTLYPLSILFYVMPLEAAYGWFTALQIALAGINMYLFCRVLKLHPLAAFFSGTAFMFSGFLIVSVVFTMFVAAVVWLPLLLAIIELIIRKQEAKGNQSFRPIPYVVAGALTIGLVTLAGHPELIYYTMIVAGLYSLVRLIVAGMRLKAEGNGEPGESQTHWGRRIGGLAGWLLTMAVVGIGIGAIQLIPLVELLPYNFREGSASFGQVLEWAWPERHILTFFLPNVFGNPSHHEWYNIWLFRWIPVTMNSLGEPVDNTFWGIKNYVEGGNYLGLATWLLAAVAVVRTQKPATRHQSPATSFFSGLALLSLLFAFGTPIYAILYYGLPGWSQLHSPFRWVFPFTLSMSVLAGIGLDYLLQSNLRDWRLLPSQNSEQTKSRFKVDGQMLLSRLSLLAALTGIGALLVVGISILMPEPFKALGQRAVDGIDLVQMAFVDGMMFWSYQAGNLAKFGLFAMLSGATVWFLLRLQRPATAERNSPMTRLLALVLILITVADLYVAHGHFNPAAPVALSPYNVDNQPPVVRFMEERTAQVAAQSVDDGVDLWRFTTFDMPGEKTFNANVGMYYGWHDIRGYDSVIPRQYTQLMERVAPQRELLYNRIAALYSDVAGYDILENPLLDLLNIRYIFTQHVIPNPSWTEIYRDPEMSVYENADVMDRAFIVREARIAPPELQPLIESDLSQIVFIEETPAEENALAPASPELAEATVSTYAANGLFVDLNMSDRGWLVVTDAYFPGWKAYIRPFGGDENEEEELTIYRANGAFRTVYIPESGQWTVRFVYSPLSFKLGLYTTFLALMTSILLLLWWGWGRYYRPEEAGEMQTVAKNSLVPMALSLFNKLIDFAFAMLYARLLGPEGTGKYYFVVAIYGFFEIFSRYGLGTLVTRDVAADKEQASRYLTNVLTLRTLLWVVMLPLMALVVFGYQLLERTGWSEQSIGQEEIFALALLTLAMLFANWSDTFSSFFYAFEKMEYTSGFANAAALFKVALGALVLLLGWGFVGLAGVSLLVNFLQLFFLYRMMRGALFKPVWQLDWSLQRWMMGTSGPLMINHLLSTIFWRIDIWILRPIAGAASVGLYSIGIKYLDGLNIIPSVFTMAVFPLMSRYARRADEESKSGSSTSKPAGNHLLRSYILSARLLLMISLPIALTMTVLAEPLVALVGGSKFLGMSETVQLFGRSFTYSSGSDLALRVIIWSIPIGFVNSVTQYVLIAVNQQRYLTKAFIIGVVFNTVGNLLVIPKFGYLGAAIITILSEFSLLFPFYYSVKRHVGTVPWLTISLPPILSILLAGAVILALAGRGMGNGSALIIGLLTYGLALLITGAFRGEDMAQVARALPLGPMKRLFV